MKYTYIQYTIRCCVIGKRVNRGAGYGYELGISVTKDVREMLREQQISTEWLKKAAEHEIQLTNDMKKCLK